jgi:Predicted protease
MRRASLLHAAVALTGAAALAWTPAAAQATPTASPANGHAFTNACAMAITPGTAACHAKVRTDVVQPDSLAPNALPSGYGPADLQDAYNLPSATAGSGQTVAIVDAFDNPNAESDLATYRSTFGLSPCTTANGCFRKVNQDGNASPLPATDVGWGEEIALDLDMVSAICPNCNILLVEANDNSFANLGAAVNRAVALGAKYVSNSYGGGEGNGEQTIDTQFYNHPGIVVTASSGDAGFGVEIPAAFSHVVAVGGTSLVRNTSARGWGETVWSGAGSGCSRFIAKPSWQTDSGCSFRTVADVAAVADPNTGVAVVDTFGTGTTFLVFGGTSVSSPIIASVYALAGAPVAGSSPSSFPYAHTSSLFDVTSGSNGHCKRGVTYLCTGGTGYDGPTGLGTPNGTGAFHA